MKAVRRIAVSLGLVLLLALVGCDTIPTAPADSSFFAARLQDCKPGAFIPPRDHFAAGEVPALVCVNYPGRTVTIRVLNTTSSALCWNNTEYIPRDRETVWWSLKALPSGTYKAEISMGGTFLRSCQFEILRPAPARR
jgi:hypothetical protein